MDKIKQVLRGVARDWWIAALDIIAVNAAYFLALLIRFYVNFEFRPTVTFYLTDFATFAPFYTVLCLIVFAAFHLYGGMWKYAGLNDLNRIIAASVVTTAMQVLGTVLFVGRMPVTYYFIGALIQFVLIASIRFGYRFLLIEKKKLENRRKTGAATMVIGAGEAGRFMIRNLEESTSYRPVCVVDVKKASYGRMMNGIPVWGGTDDVERALDVYGVKCIFLAEPLMQPEIREKIARLCQERRIELQDLGYTFYMNADEQQAPEEPLKPAAKADGKRAIPFSPPDISESEISEVVEALRSGWITTGPRTKLLERRLAAFIETGRVDIEAGDEYSNRVVCLNSATAAEELNLRVLGVGPGDEVIVPALTYSASASAAIHCGATVIFVDVQKDGDPLTRVPEMDYDALEAAITPRTKAVVAVDYGGIVCDYERIFDIVERRKALFTPVESDGSPLKDLGSRIQKALGRVAVISDCAHGLGASRVFRGEKKYTGAIADMTSFSFHAVKNFTTAEGGASTWLPIPGVDNAEIYKMFQLLSLHGQNKDALAKTKLGAWEYDIIGPWYKCNMTDIMAAIGLRQLDRYPGLLERRVEMMKKYDAVCAELGVSHLVHHVAGMDSSNHLYITRVPGITAGQRNEIIEKMAQRGVATNVHYKPLPMMTAYGRDCSAYPNASDYYHNLITLPLHTLLSDEDVDYVCQAFREVVKEYI